MYEVNSLSFSYGKRQILDDVKLSFPKHKMRLSLDLMVVVNRHFLDI